MNDLISVIIPCKNGENYLKEALEGIRRQNMSIEIIVVDDGSTDRTADIAQSYGCKVIRQSVSEGQVVAKNKGLESSQGQYVMFHDHDDVMRENALATLYNALISDNEHFGVMGKVKDFISPDAQDKNTPIQSEPYWGLFTGAVLLKKEVFTKVGLFSESLHTGEIIELTKKMDDAGLKIKKIDFITTDRRVHDTNFGKTNKNTEFKDYASVLRARLRKV